MEISMLQREFDLNGIRLPDLDPDAKDTDVIEMYSKTYAELVNGFVEETKIVNGVNVVYVKTSVGTKG